MLAKVFETGFSKLKFDIDFNIRKLFQTAENNLKYKCKKCVIVAEEKDQSLKKMKYNFDGLQKKFNASLENIAELKKQIKQIRSEDINVQKIIKLKLELKQSKEEFEKMCFERDTLKKDAKQNKKESSELFEDINVMKIIMNLKLELKQSKEDFEKMCSERDIWKKDAKQIKKENSELFEFGSRKEKRVKELEKIIDLKNDQKENSVYARKNNIENLLISSMIVRSRARTNLKLQFLSYFSNCNF